MVEPRLMTRDERPYTPERLAERWDVNERTIRRMLNDGELVGFKVGNMWRIAASEVRAREQAWTTTSPDYAGIEEDGPSTSTTAPEQRDAASVSRLVRQAAPRRKVALTTGSR